MDKIVGIVFETFSSGSFTDQRLIEILLEDGQTILRDCDSQEIVGVIEISDNLKQDLVDAGFKGNVKVFLNSMDFNLSV